MLDSVYHMTQTNSSFLLINVYTCTLVVVMTLQHTMHVNHW